MKTAAAVLAALIAFTLGLLSCTPPANSAESTPGVTYSAHVQRIGWQAPVDDGATAGTTGKGLRVEAVQVRIVQGPEPEPTPTPSSTVTPAPSPTVTPSTPAPTLTPGCVRSGGGWLCYGTTPPTP